MRLSAQIQAGAVGWATLLLLSTRESAVAPYSNTRPSAASTVKYCGPTPAPANERMRAKDSISVRYSAPAAP